jgi:hypothetical protein
MTVEQGFSQPQWLGASSRSVQPAKRVRWVSGRSSISQRPAERRKKPSWMHRPWDSITGGAGRHPLFRLEGLPHGLPEGGRREENGEQEQTQGRSGAPETGG